MKNNFHLKKLHLYSTLKKYAKQVKARFHMPGHKGKLKALPFIKDVHLDCTELSVTDCLENPKDILYTIEQEISTIFSAKKSYLITDGATCGIFAMLYLVKKSKGTIAIPRNAHKSVYNACALFGIEPVILKQHIQHAILQQPSLQDIALTLQDRQDIFALLITSPDYYGNVAQLKEIQKLCKSKNILLFVDNAHGAYLKYDARYSERYYAGHFADVWVDSLHKTTPCLTQGALLHTNCLQLCTLLEEALLIFRTTSPSYLIMASIEYAAKYLQEFGREKSIELHHAIEQAKIILEKNQIMCYAKSHTLVLAVDFFSAGYDVQKVQNFLEKRGVFAEINDGYYLLFYFSIMNTKKEINFLVQIILQLQKQKDLKRENKSFDYDNEDIPIRVCSYLEAQNTAVKYLPLKECEGRVAARNIGITPPCYPILVAGEKITANILAKIEVAVHTFGMQDNCLPTMDCNTDEK